jgi:hypothetical protein
MVNHRFISDFLYSAKYYRTTVSLGSWVGSYFSKISLDAIKFAKSLKKQKES